MSKKYRNDAINGFLNIYKEKDYTSHDVVAIISKITGAKAGHAGTLDPNAEGVLPVCLGRATKLSDYIMSSEKTYRAELILGVTTDTEDITGNVLTSTPVELDREYVRNVIHSFKGESLQTPPMFSAIKVNGRRLYDLARLGIKADRQQRVINILDIKVIEFISPVKVSIEVTCSKGTYIRTLCTDIGEKLGCGACMGSLTRTRAGEFRLEDSLKLSQIKDAYENNSFDEIIISYEEVLKFSKVTLDEAASKFAHNGNKIMIGYAHSFVNADCMVFVYDSEKEIVGLYKEDSGYLYPKVMLNK